MKFDNKLKSEGFISFSGRTYFYHMIKNLTTNESNALELTGVPSTPPSISLTNKTQPQPIKCLIRLYIRETMNKHLLESGDPTVSICFETMHVYIVTGISRTMLMRLKGICGDLTGECRWPCRNTGAGLALAPYTTVCIIHLSTVEFPGHVTTDVKHR